VAQSGTTFHFLRSTILRNSLRLMLGVVSNPPGRLHFQKGTESQTSCLLEGFRVSDPIDGTFSTRMRLEAFKASRFCAATFLLSMATVPRSCRSIPTQALIPSATLRLT
jgi:hypothetical protein